MQTSNANQNFRCDNPVWILLAELSLGDFLSDHDRRAGPTLGFLFQTTRELGMSPEYVENIARTLAGFAREASVRYKQEKLEFHGPIRIFCQKKIIDNANAEKTSRPYPTQQGKKQKQIFPDPGASRMGAWGYFTIERGGNLSTGSTLSAGNSVDVYLYKEGE